MNARAAREIVEDVLGPATTRGLWGGDYRKVLPVAIQDFDLAAVLPAVFYLFRFGFRRGRGRFVATFGNGQPRVTIEDLARTLASDERLRGFEDPAGQAILGDLLLSFCFENRGRALGRKEPVQRVLPVHYFSSWLDLPDGVAHLRHVPEAIVAMLANQDGPIVNVTAEGTRTWFPVATRFQENVLLRPFLRGVKHEGELSSRTADRFDEAVPVGIDELLMIRVAQWLKEAPDRARGRDEERIPNQRPLAEQAARNFSEDMRRFVRAYSGVVPRPVFVELLESCMAVGLSTVLRSTARLLFAWAESGEVLPRSQETPLPLFVDCSNGVNQRLRASAEDSFDEFLRQVGTLPPIFSALRILDFAVRTDPRLRQLHVESAPSARDWVRLLGDVLHGRHERAPAIHDDLARKAEQLAQELEAEYPQAARILRGEETQPNVVWRLAEALVFPLGRKNTSDNLMHFIDGAFCLGRTSGLAVKRRTLRTVPETGKKVWVDLRCAVLSEPVLDYLVHLHLLPSGNKAGTRALSFRDFLRVLRERYGLYADEAPPGLSLSNELLQANRAALERRLRDLGLLVSVSDAEAMKSLRPRFLPVGSDELD